MLTEAATEARRGYSLPDAGVKLLSDGVRVEGVRVRQDGVQNAICAANPSCSPAADSNPTPNGVRAIWGLAGISPR